MEHPPDYSPPETPPIPSPPGGEGAVGLDALPPPRVAAELALGELPAATVVVLNYNGLRHLEPCFSSLLDLDYPADRLELMLVDNASTDGSVEFMRKRFPSVRVVETGGNIGFAAGNNFGAREATGAYVAFLNNDTRVDPRWLREMMNSLVADAGRGAVCTSSLMLDWTGTKIDFQAGALNFHGFGFQPSYGGKVEEQDLRPRDLLFACGGSMLIQRDVFLAAGGFDPDYFAFFEDVDLGWRLWLLGYRVTLTPTAITYHRHHGTAGSIPGHRTQLLYERNALYTIFKNYGDARLQAILPAALLLLGQRAVRFAEIGGVDFGAYDAATAPPARPGEQDSENVHRFAIASLLAVDEFRDNLDLFTQKRAWLQARRVRSDADLFELFGQPGRVHLLNHETDGPYAAAHFSVLREFGIEADWASQAKEVLVISPDVLPVGDIPATGSGIRAWALGQGLALRGHRVRFTMPSAAIAGREDLVPREYRETAWSPETLQTLVDAWHPDVVVSCGWPNLTWLPRANLPVAVDLTGPHLLERAYQQYRDARANSDEKVAGLRRADFFTCIGERQRYYFTGWLALAGVPVDDIEQALAVVPYSLSPDQPAHVWPETWSGEDVRFVYGGIFLPWQNPAPALLGVASVLAEEGKGVLEVIGGKHPFHAVDTGAFGPLVDSLATMPRVQMSGLLAHDALIERYRRAHVAVDVMQPNPERALAFPSRTVHYMWCGLPVIHAAFSEVAEHIRDWEAGWVVPHDDPDALAATVRAILAHPREARRRGENAQRLVRERFSWDRTIDALDRFVRLPYVRPGRVLSRRKPDQEARAQVRSGAYLLHDGAQSLPTELRAVSAKRRKAGSLLAARSAELVRSLVAASGGARPKSRTREPAIQLPELIAGHSHGQRFYSPHNGLSAIRVQVSTFGRSNTCRLSLHLRANPAASTDLRTYEVPAYRLEDGATVLFKFAPIADSAGKWFFFVADSPDGVPGDAVTLLADAAPPPSGGQRYEDGLPARGSLRVTPVCDEAPS